MACCGKQRSRWSGAAEAPGARRRAAGSPPPAAPPRASVVVFEYRGATAITVVGAGTGKRYRFSHPGAIVAADLRDRRSLAAVPTLQQVRS